MKQGEYALSVIVPVYGVEKYIAQCARSLFSQDMQGLEFIFVDDCSPDSSIPILETIINCEYPSLKEDIQIIRLPQNKGVSNARNVGISKATGDYVTFCDSDDWIEADMYSNLHSTAKETNADISACNFVNEYDGYTRVIHQPYSSDMEINMRRLLVGDIFPSLCTSIVRRSLYVNHFVTFPEEMNMGEDLAVNVCLYCHAARIVSLSKPFYHYRHYKESACMQKSLSSIESDIQVAGFIEKYLTDNHLEEKHRKAIRYRKFFSKLPLWTNSSSRNYQRWLSVYPDTNKYIFSYSRLNWKMKIEYALAAYGMPNVADRFVRFLRFQRQIKDKF